MHGWGWGEGALRLSSGGGGGEGGSNIVEKGCKRWRSRSEATMRMQDVREKRKNKENDMIDIWLSQVEVLI